MKEVKIRVYNNNKLVYEGILSKFIKDNDYDLDLVGEVQKLMYQNVVEFNFYHSGSWRIETVK